MTQPESHDDNPVSVVTSMLARRDSGKADDADLMDDGRLLVTADPCQTDPVTPFLASLRAEIGEQNFQHWFYKRTRFKVAGDRVVVFVANPFILNWLLRRFRSALNRAAQLVLGPSAACQLEVDGSLLNEAVSSASDVAAKTVAETGTVQKDGDVPSGATNSASSRNRTNSVASQPSEFDRPGSL